MKLPMPFEYIFPYYIKHTHLFPGDDIKIMSLRIHIAVILPHLEWWTQSSPHNEKTGLRIEKIQSQ